MAQKRGKRQASFAQNLSPCPKHQAQESPKPIAISGLSAAVAKFQASELEFPCGFTIELPAGSGIILPRPSGHISAFRFLALFN